LRGRAAGSGGRAAGALLAILGLLEADAGVTSLDSLIVLQGDPVVLNSENFIEFSECQRIGTRIYASDDVAAFHLGNSPIFSDVNIKLIIIVDSSRDADGT